MTAINPCSVQMPKACISCVHFTGQGFADDEHCPFEDWNGPKKRTPFGTCGQHRQEVFATEICGSYQCEAGVISHQVDNRPQPRLPLQEQLFAQGGAA